MSYAVAVDIGGTFTDLVAFDHRAGSVRYAKSPTTYGNFVQGILSCFAKAAIEPSATELVSHGTTLVINSLIQRRGAETALVTTKGFRDLLEIARGNRADPLDLHYRRDPPLIARNRRFELAERIDATGRICAPLDMAGLSELATRLQALGVESVAIFFLNSYLNTEHERRAAEGLRALLPDVFVTASTELCKEMSEYERASTASANAYVGPEVESYVKRLESDLEERGFAGAVFMMGSNGGLLSVERSCRQPVALVESGPIGGCIGASAYAQALGFDKLIAFDMGGTTAKCALVSSGAFTVGSVYFVRGEVHGLPIKTPVIDIVEVGSGGGSIARLDDKGQLHVGPESAGSTPGPACYGSGGTDATVTDANLLLGRIDAASFLGGELPLDAEAARAAVAGLASRLDLAGAAGTIHIADGIIEIATIIMAGAIRRISIEHGHDPRDFVLFAYGGGGPLHASALARELAIPTIVIPPEPGNFSAIGMLLADARLDRSETHVVDLAAGSLSEIERRFAAMEAELATALRDDFGAAEMRFTRHAELRYRGQHSNVKVEVTGMRAVEAMRGAFERDYKSRFGQINADGRIELQVLHVSGFALLRQPEIASLPRERRDAAPPARRPVHYGKRHGTVDAAIYQRAALAPGFAASGPAVIEEYGSTTLIWPEDRFAIGPLGEIRIQACLTGEAP